MGSSHNGARPLVQLKVDWFPLGLTIVADADDLEPVISLQFFSPEIKFKKKKN